MTAERCSLVHVLYDVIAENDSNEFATRDLVQPVALFHDDTMDANIRFKANIMANGGGRTV